MVTEDYKLISKDFNDYKESLLDFIEDVEDITLAMMYQNEYNACDGNINKLVLTQLFRDAFKLDVIGEDEFYLHAVNID